MTGARLDDAIADSKTYASEADLDALFAQLRRDDPVHWTEPDGVRPFWTLTKHADVLAIEKRADIFLNAPRGRILRIDAEEKLRANLGRGLMYRMIVNMDGAEHRAHRAIANYWFEPKNLQRLNDDIAALAKEFVERLASFGGSCDFARDIAVWYPLRVIMLILGIPAEDAERVLRLSRQTFASDDAEIQRPGTDGTQTRMQAAQEFFDYFRALRDERRLHPTDDLATVIAHAEVDGKPIGDLEAMSYYIVVATAGHDTTSASTAGGLLALMQHPAELQRLSASPALLGSAVEEMFRWVTPVKHFFRTATEDYTLRGKTIKSGDAVMLAYPSVNRDEEIFDDAFAFRIDRNPNKHLAFGTGAHVCLGKHLAKMEVMALFAELLPRLESIELDGAPAWLETSFVGGLKRLPIRYRMKHPVSA